MTVFITLRDGGSQESYNVRDLRVERGFVLIDGRRIAISRIETLNVQTRT